MRCAYLSLRDRNPLRFSNVNSITAPCVILPSTILGGRLPSDSLLLLNTSMYLTEGQLKLFHIYPVNMVNSQKK